MENSNLTNLVSLVDSYANLGHSIFLDNVDRNLKHIVYDTIFENSGNVFFEEGSKEFYSTLKKIAEDSLSDITYPKEKSEILARLYLFGGSYLQSRGLSTTDLDDFCSKHIDILKKWAVDVINDVYEDSKKREEIAKYFGEHHNTISLNEKLKITQNVLKDFFEYIDSKKPSLKENYKRGIVKISNSSTDILLKHYNLNLLF